MNDAPRNAMTKADLINIVAKQARHHPGPVGDHRGGRAQSIVNALQNGQEVEIRGFGSFRFRNRAPRKGRNPKTGEKVDVPPKKIPYFKMGKELKALLNGKPLAEEADRPEPHPRVLIAPRRLSGGGLGAMIRAAAVLALPRPPTLPLASLVGLPARLPVAHPPAVLYRLGTLRHRASRCFLAGRAMRGGGPRAPRRRARNTVVMPNHVSHLDAPVLFAGPRRSTSRPWPRRRSSRSRSSAACCASRGFIEVDRADAHAGARGRATARRSALREGNCFLIFPEGTAHAQRASSGPFKKGGLRGRHRGAAAASCPSPSRARAS